jgi:hypothetical protein
VFNLVSQEADERGSKPAPACVSRYLYRQPARVAAVTAVELIKPTMVPLSALPVMTIDAPETNSAVSVNGTV